MIMNTSSSPVARFLWGMAAFIVVVAGMRAAESLLVPFLLSLFIAVIVSPFGFFEMQMKGVFGQALELGESHFGHAPEALDAVDVDAAPDEFILAVIDTEVAVSEIDEAGIPSPSVRVDHRAWIDFPPDNAL